MVISVEASSSTFKTLLKNTQDLGDRVKCLHYAVTNKNAPTITFFNCVNEPGLSTLNKTEWLDNPEGRFYGVPSYEEIVPTITLDKLIELYGIPDLIKIDVEGAEVDVIKYLSQKVPCLCFEWASEMRTAACMDLMKILGFTKFFIQMADDYVYRPMEEDYTNCQLGQSK